MPSGCRTVYFDAFESRRTQYIGLEGVIPIATPTATPTPAVCVTSAGTAALGEAAANAPVCQEGTGLRGDYFTRRNFEQFLYTITDPVIDYDWGSGSADDFSIIWTGNLLINFNGHYEFCTISDDGVQLWVDDQLIISNWIDHSSTENCATIWLLADYLHPVRMEYYEHTGSAVVKLLWREPNQQKGPIPSWRLYPAIVAAVPPPPAPPNQPCAVPLTTDRIKQIAINYPQIIWENDPVPPVDSVAWYGDIGRDFQQLVLRQVSAIVRPNTQNYPSAVREIQPGGRPAVRPDGFSDVTIYVSDGNGNVVPVIVPNSDVIEIKAKKGTISPSYSAYQIIGMIDISITSTALGQTYNMGVVSLITTGNTVINDALKWEATTRRVLLCQAWVWEIPGSTPATSLFWVSPAILRNPEVLPILGAQQAVCNPNSNTPHVWQGVQGQADPTDPDPALLEEG